MNFLRNAWYVAGFSDEFAAGVPKARTLLQEPILFFRTALGELIALADRCPHRFAPLSAGKLCDDGESIQCPYHGLRFGKDGNCVHNPHGDGAVPKAAAVKSYVVRERDRLVWLWAGDGRADESLIPDFSHVTSAPKEVTVRGHMPTACDYQLLVDNILDLTHADYVHAGSLGSGAVTRSKSELTDLGERSMRVAWNSSGDLASLVFDAYLREHGKPTNQWTVVTWTAPGIMLLHVGATLLGEPRESGADSLNLHIATPESEGRCHYWYWSTRNFAVDAEANKKCVEMIEYAFSQQDKPILEAQQARIGTAEFWSLKPVLLSGDVGAVRVRRKLQQLIAAEGTAT